MPVTDFLDAKLLAPNLEDAKPKLKYDFDEILGKEKFFQILRQSVTVEKKTYWDEQLEERVK